MIIGPAPSIKPARLRAWLLNLHLYGGLICCWYLLVYGISSLSFNHCWLLPETKGERTRWERPVTVEAGSDNLKTADAVRDQLGLMGWPLPWAMSREGDGPLRFEMSRPGRHYWIRYDPNAGMAAVETESRGIGSILHFLHGSTEGVPNSRFLNAWGVYTEITNWLVLYFIISGVWLWAWRERERKLALAILLGSLVISGGLMAYLYFVG